MAEEITERIIKNEKELHTIVCKFRGVRGGRLKKVMIGIDR